MLGCVFQGLRPPVLQLWHHGGGLPGQLHVSGADHLQLQSAGMKLPRKSGVLILDVCQNLELPEPFLCDETIDFGAMNAFVGGSYGNLEKPTDGFQQVGENPPVSNMN